MRSKKINNNDDDDDDDDDDDKQKKIQNTEWQSESGQFTQMINTNTLENFWKKLGHVSLFVTNYLSEFLSYKPQIVHNDR